MAAALWAMCVVAAAQAQETRTAILEKQQAEKALVARPFKPGRLERFVGYADRNDLIERLTDGDGFFPKIGGITTGGGLSFGGGYRRHLFDYRGVVEASAARSIKGYRQIGLEVAFPELFDRRLEVGSEITYRFFPQEDFYGLGPGAADDRVNFAIEGSDYASQAAVKPRSWFTAGTRVGYLNANIGRGTDAAFPSIEERFDKKTAPGLDAQPNFLYGQLFADLDTRDEPGNPRTGTHYRADWIRYEDRDLNRFSFSRLNSEASHFFAIFDKKRVFLVRGRLTLSDPDAGNEVPFFLAPALGGSHTLRSVDDFRFRANHRLLFNVEYRWEAFAALDMALFADAGKVATRRADVDFTGLREAYGLGFRFNTSRRILFRIDIARGPDGFHYYLKFSGPFKDGEQWPVDTQAHRHKKVR